MESSLAYQYEYPEELINGEAVAMSPSPAHNHIWVANNLNFIFGNYLRGKKCRVYPDGFDVHLSKKDIFKPDMMVVCDRDKIKPNGIYGAPDLVVEVLSRSTAHRDKGYKKDTYAKSGVREYWLVDPGNESIEVYLNADGVFTLDNIYFNHYPEWELERLSEAERAAIPTHFRCSLFGDLEIALADVFDGLLPSS